jgi:hypothetical protein
MKRVPGSRLTLADLGVVMAAAAPRRVLPRHAWRLTLALLLALVSTGAAHAQPSVASQFDHFTTAFRLDGAHQFAACESCHVDGQFAGTPVECAGCHTQGSRVQATAKPAQHHLATAQCDSCHRTAAWVPVARVDHLEVLGACQSCHDNVRAMGKPANHIPAGNQCDDCHRTSAWPLAVFSHSGITSGCFGCHNGTFAITKPPNHIPATNVCEDCHNVVAFSSVARVDHLQVLGVCSGCHNNVVAAGQPVGHIQTTQECDSCHNTTSFAR